MLLRVFGLSWAGLARVGAAAARKWKALPRMNVVRAK